MSEAIIRAEIAATLAAVAGVGTVHDYPRYSRSLAAWLELMRDSGTVNGWIVHREKTVTRWDNYPTMIHDHHFRIAGVYEMSDENATANDFQAILAAIVSRFADNAGTSGTRLSFDPVQIDSVDVLDIGETLYHSAELLLVAHDREVY
jgi:hypothetical protein